MTLSEQELATWRKADALYQALLEVEKADRPKFLQNITADQSVMQCLRELIAAGDSTSMLDDDALAVLKPIAEHALSGQSIGRWTLHEEVGRGGMAVVYKASRKVPGGEQVAAIKILPRGMTGQQQFAQENAVLAQLEHPNIARYLDGGVDTDGSPWLAMEYIEGQRIDTDVKKLSIRQRVQLVLPIVDALAEAHRLLIVHRDIKPGNVMLDAQGRPRLLDFGIAKLLRTELEQQATRVLTPEFAAPEQFAGGQITTATDVYGLGALLVALLTGKPPRSRNYELQLSLDSRTLGRDLCNIIHKALHVDPGRRYASAQAFGSDLQNWLDGHPVSATGDSRMYRVTKWLGRHKAATFATSALLLAILVGSGLVYRQSLRVQAKAETVAAQNAVLKDLLAAPQSVRFGRQVKVVDLLKDAPDTIKQHMRAPSAERAELYASLARTLQQLGEMEQAITLWDAALDDVAEGAEMSAQAQVWAQITRARALEAQGQLQIALDTLRKIRDTPQKALPEDHPIWALWSISYYVMLLKYDAVEAREFYTTLQQWDAPQTFADPGQRGFFSCGRTQSMIRNGEFQNAVSFGEANLDWARSALGDRHSNTICIIQSLVHANARLGMTEKAEQYAREALSITKAWLGEYDPMVFKLQNSIANLVGERGDYDQAIQLHQQSLALLEHTQGVEPEIALSPLQGIAIALLNAGRYAEAAPYQRRFVTEFAALMGADQPQAAMARANLAELLLYAGEHEEGLQSARKAYQDLLTRAGAEHPITLFAQSVLGGALTMNGHHQDAVDLLQGLDDRMAAVMGEADINVINTRFRLAHAMVFSDKRAAVLPMLEEVNQWRITNLGTEHPRTLASKNLLNNIKRIH